MNDRFLFFVVEDDKVLRKIIADFVRQAARNYEIPSDVKLYEAHSGEEALTLFESIFKTGGEPKALHRGETIVPQPGQQAKAIVLCDFDMEPIGGREILQHCMGDEILRDMNFIMMAQQPDIGLVSELGELGVLNIMAKPLTLDKFSYAVRNMITRVRSEEYGCYKEAERLLEAGEFEKALRFVKSVESKYTSLRWVILRGRAYLGLNETEQAKSDFEQAETGAHIASVIALKHMVDIYDSTGDTKKAIESLSKLTTKSPNNVDRKLRLAELFIEDNRPNEAKGVLDPLAKEKRTATKIKMRVASLFEKAGFVSDATNMKMQTVDDKLDDFAFCNDIAIGLRRQGLYEEAENIYRKIIEDHSNEAIIWFNRAVNLGAWGRHAMSESMLREAIDCFRSALKLDQDLTDAYQAMERLKAEIKSLKKD